MGLVNSDIKGNGLLAKQHGLIKMTAATATSGCHLTSLLSYYCCRSAQENPLELLYRLYALPVNHLAVLRY